MSGRPAIRAAPTTAGSQATRSGHTHLPLGHASPLLSSCDTSDEVLWDVGMKHDRALKEGKERGRGIPSPTPTGVVVSCLVDPSSNSRSSPAPAHSPPTDRPAWPGDAMPHSASAAPGISLHCVTSKCSARNQHMPVDIYTSCNVFAQFTPECLVSCFFFWKLL